MTDDEIAALRASCPRALTHSVRPPAKRALEELAATLDGDIAFDTYGAAPWLAEFEARIARELGKEAAVFMPTGTLAQPIALRIWCDAARNPVVAFHPTCHLDIWESRGYAMLHGLRALTVGAATRLMTAADVRAIADPLGAFLVELPQREIGAQLLPWDDLVELCAAARATGAKLHLDGARLWEAAPFYGRSHAEIASLFDSAYVSFYKGLGAFAGAMLAGDAAFIALARQWQHRSGGRPYALAPYALSARLGFERNVGKMAAYRDRAVAIARELETIDGVTIVPDPPQTNTFHIYLAGDRERLEDAAHAYARETGTFAFARLGASPIPGMQKWEFVAAEATMALDVVQVADAVRRIVGVAASNGRVQSPV
jgi:threonine aldolase